MSSYKAYPQLATPTPAHAQTPGAEAARRAVAAHGRRRREAPIVATHPKRHSGVVPPAAEIFTLAAIDAGFHVKVIEGWATTNAGRANERKVEAIQVAGIDKAKRRGFRAVWANKRAYSAIWYETGVTPMGGQSIGVAAVAARIKGEALR